MLAKANKNSMKVSSLVTMAHMVETTGMMMVSVRLLQMIIFTILMFIFLMFTILMFSIPINDSQCCGDGSRRNCNRSVSDQHVRLKILFFENYKKKLLQQMLSIMFWSTAGRTLWLLAIRKHLQR